MNASTVINARNALIDDIDSATGGQQLTSQSCAEIADWLLGNDYIAASFFEQFEGDDE